MRLTVHRLLHQGSLGPIGSRGVSDVTDMGGLFVDANYNYASNTCLLDYLASGVNEYNNDRHVREVLLLGIVQCGSLYVGRVSVISMINMFNGASSFSWTLCGAWFGSTARECSWTHLR